jgi:diguanylate cyclase (GGDEF)-like protein
LQENVRMRDELLRWGGEEFLVCLPNAMLSDALVVAKKLRRAIADITRPLQA